MNLHDYRSRLNTMEAEKGLLSKQLASDQERLVALKVKTGDLDKARAIHQKAAVDTQENLRVRVESLVTNALRAVFRDKDLAFHLAFEMKRGRTECVLTMSEDGHQIDPLLGHGGGPCDIASFALRCAFWSMDRTRPVMILDEPMKFLRGSDLLTLAANMVKTVADKLGLQIIMVTHIKEFIGVADKSFEITTNGKGISTVEAE